MGLKEEIEYGWQELYSLYRSGKLDEFEEELSGEIDCVNDEVLEAAKKTSEIEETLEERVSISKVPSGSKLRDAYTQFKSVNQLLEERKQELKECIRTRIQLLEEAREAAEQIGYDEAISENAWGVRFNLGDFKERYDEELAELKEAFDETSRHNRKNIRKFQELAERTEELRDKYKSIDDKVGADRAARLHSEIEEAAEKLAPIHESWKRRNITLGMVLLAGVIGFWKGDYFKQQASLILRDAAPAVKRFQDETMPSLLGKEYSMTINSQEGRASLSMGNSRVTEFPTSKIDAPSGNYLTVHDKDKGQILLEFVGDYGPVYMKGVDTTAAFLGEMSSSDTIYAPDDVLTKVYERIADKDYPMEVTIK